MGLLYGRRRGSSRVWLDFARIVSYNILAWIPRVSAPYPPRWHADIRAKTAYRGVAQLVARLLWEQDAGSSSLPTPTKTPLKS